VRAGSGAALVGELARIVGAEHVLHGDDARPYESDATAWRGLRGTPDAVVLPGSPEEVAAVVRFGCEHQLALVPRGGGTGLAGGAVPVGGGVVVALERLRAIHELAPESWRLRVGAGVSTATVKRLARENGLFFGPDPGASEQSQIGGNVATNAGGPHAFKYGSTGAWVSGIEAVLAPGEIVSLGGALRRDVGGYDLKSLLVGSEGTLAVITAVTLRLLPAPEATLPLVAFFASLDAGADAVAEVIGSGLQPTALDYLDGDTLAIVAGGYPGSVPAGSRFVLLCEVDGTREEAERQRRELRELLADGALRIEEPDPAALWRWREGVSGTVAGVRGGKVAEDIVVPVSELAAAARAVQELGEELGMPTCTWGHAGDGNMHANLLVDPREKAELDTANAAAERLFSLAIGLGGGVTGEHGIGYLKRGALAKQWQPPELALHEQIKHTFDPGGVLNPGKKLARVQRQR
jgi:glycolate dehydrogenase FAD-linked subunit